MQEVDAELPAKRSVPACLVVICEPKSPAVLVLSCHFIEDEEHFLLTLNICAYRTYTTPAISDAGYDFIERCEISQFAIINSAEEISVPEKKM